MQVAFATSSYELTVRTLSSSEERKLTAEVTDVDAPLPLMAAGMQGEIGDIDSLPILL